MEVVNVCPKCGYSAESKFIDCPKCGIIVNKYLENERRDRELSSQPVVSEEQPHQTGTGSRGSKIIITVIIALGIFWGWTRLNRNSGADLGYRSDGSYTEALKISDGERVDLKEHLADGSYTVFLFYADW